MSGASRVAKMGDKMLPVNAAENEEKHENGSMKVGGETSVKTGGERKVKPGSGDEKMGLGFAGDGDGNKDARRPVPMTPERGRPRARVDEKRSRSRSRTPKQKRRDSLMGQLASPGRKKPRVEFKDDDEELFGQEQEEDESNVAHFKAMAALMKQSHEKRNPGLSALLGSPVRNLAASPGRNDTTRTLHGSPLVIKSRFASPARQRLHFASPVRGLGVPTLNSVDSPLGATLVASKRKKKRSNLFPPLVDEDKKAYVAVDSNQVVNDSDLTEHQLETRETLKAENAEIYLKRTTKAGSTD